MSLWRCLESISVSIEVGSWRLDLGFCVTGKSFLPSTHEIDFEEWFAIWTESDVHKEVKWQADHAGQDLG